MYQYILDMPHMTSMMLELEPCLMKHTDVTITSISLILHHVGPAAWGPGPSKSNGALGKK